MSFSRRFSFVCLLLLVSLGVAGLFLKPTLPVKAIDEIQQLEDEIKKLAELKALSENATTPLEAEVKNLESRINGARASIARAKEQAKQLATSIEEREKELSYHYQIFTNRVSESYKRSRTFNPLALFLASQSASQLTKELAYQESAKTQDDRLIRSVSAEITKLNEDKKKLESDQVRLAALEKQLNSQADFFKGEIAKAKNYQKELSGKIAELSAKQQAILSARSGSFTISLGSGEYGSSGKSSRTHFLNEAPSGYFAVFSFGGYSHRKGMSQYGAFGRVKTNSSITYEDLLKYYYPGVNIETVDTNVNINVNGTNTYGQSFNNEAYQLEDYLKHIYEIPPSWPKEVLKAQAIATRSFAYGKNSICPSQNCQEFKREINSSSWQEAVDETRGKIMRGGPNSYQYSSTTGGFIYGGIGWDTTDGQGGGNFLDKSYEAIAGSPWVYSAWYADVFGEWGPKGNTCGRSNPWLSPEEMADIVNAHLVLRNGGSNETERISSTSTSCWGGNPYSVGELKDIASKYGGISSANSVSVSQGNGRTNSITINGISIGGDDFCKAFNLRAPGFLRIPQWSGSQCVSAFFNIEKK